MNAAQLVLTLTALAALTPILPLAAAEPDTAPAGICTVDPSTPAFPRLEANCRIAGDHTCRVWYSKPTDPHGGCSSVGGPP